MFWKVDALLVRVDDTLSCFSQGLFELMVGIGGQFGLVVLWVEGYLVVKSHQWDDFCRFCDNTMCQFLVELDQVANVDIAVVCSQEGIFPQLVSVCSSRLDYNLVFLPADFIPIDELVLESKVEDEL